MKEPVLVVMAAGIGSRFGAGIKQLTKVGPCQELLIDYSIYDAMEAGFRKVIFIIRHDIEADFRALIGDRLSKVMEVEYAFQEGDDLPPGFTKPAGRKKPWGTGHAILAARDLIDGPFAVINADDYYGKEGFRKLYRDLCGCPETGLYCCMVGFILRNTLSENGTVTRGICSKNAEGFLESVHETFEIRRDEDGVIRGRYGTEREPLAEDAAASMNMWGFSPALIEELKTGFETFLENVPEGDLKAEYLLPSVVDGLIHGGRLQVKVMSSPDKWFGMTYQEDREAVVESIRRYTESGFYPTPLFGD